MDHPYYTVTVESLTSGWSYSAVEGDDWDPADDVVLLSPFTYTWSFENEQIPGQLEPIQASFVIAARSATDIPAVQIGDFISLDVRVGSAGSRIIDQTAMRVATAETELIPDREYPAVLTVALVDLSVDWNGLDTLGVWSNTPWSARAHYRDRLAEIGKLFGYPIGCPTWWADEEYPSSASTGWSGLRTYHGDDYPKKMRDRLIATLNAHQPSGLYHTITTIYSGSHPSGYGYVGPTTWHSAGGYIGPAISEPSWSVRLELVPATRILPSSAGLPLQWSAAGGIFHLEPRTPASGNTMAQIALDADWCIIPATARRAREHAVNHVNYQGFNTNTTETFDYTLQVENASDVGARGASIRDVPTDLIIGASVSDGSPPGTTWAWSTEAANRFLSDATVLEAPWSFDGFTLYSSLIPQAIAAWLLPVIPPRLPGETDGDGRLVRNVTVFDIAQDVRFGGNPVTGFITPGELAIQGGDMVWTLNTAPGRPQWTGGTPGVHTVGEMSAASAGLDCGDVDPLPTIADMAYVDH